MSDNEEQISQFMGVTGVGYDRAKFYLESSAGKIEVALASFYEHDGDQNSDVEIVPGSPEPASSVPTPAPEPKPTNKPQKPNARFATLNSLNVQTTSSDEEEEGQAFYAGGSEHSGQQVLGPGKKKKDIVEEMFKSVQEHGAEVVEPTGSSGSIRAAFSGTGYKLGQSANDSEVISGSSSSHSSPTDVVLKLWRDGFSLNGGPIRAYQDPENREFLDSVRRGEIPQELVRQARGGEVHLNMEDHRHEEFQHIRSKLRAFSGTGHTLGSPAPNVTSAPIDLLPLSDEGKKTANEEKAKEELRIDSNQPTTNIQIRLADGSRLLGQFNHAHTVEDLRRFIINARPQYENRAFLLQTIFPNRELSDSSQTIVQAGILNAAVIQRLK